VQYCLIGDQPGNPSFAVFLRCDFQAIKPFTPTAVQLTLDTDFVKERLKRFVTLIPMLRVARLIQEFTPSL
jgi:hypothetical protein